MAEFEFYAYTVICDACMIIFHGEVNMGAVGPCDWCYSCTAVVTQTLFVFLKLQIHGDGKDQSSPGICWYGLVDTGVQDMSQQLRKIKCTRVGFEKCPNTQETQKYVCSECFHIH